MIYIIDDFVEKNLFKLANQYLDENKFNKVIVGEKDFYIQDSNKDFDEYIATKLSIIEGKKIWL